MPIERIIVLAKTYPELSTKYGPLVCVAGINEYKEWLRLYPIPYDIWINEKYKNIRFKKWDIIEVEVSDKTPPHDKRFESRRVNSWEKIKIVTHIDDWSVRLDIIKQFLDKDIEYIIDSERSLGIIKPNKVYDFFSKPRQRLREEAEKDVLNKMDEVDSTVTLLEYYNINDKHLLPEVRSSNTKIDQNPWIGYKFDCHNPLCKSHEMMVIDWEAQELFRKYKTTEGPVKQKLFYELLSDRDLYFIVGNTWKYHKSFMIISLFYPPKGTTPIKPLMPIFKDKPRQKSLSDIFEEMNIGDEKHNI